MAPGGWLYTITDVPELGEWMVSGDRTGLGGLLGGALTICVRWGVLPVGQEGICFDVCHTVSGGIWQTVCVFVCGVNCVLTHGGKACVSVVWCGPGRCV